MDLSTVLAVASEKKRRDAHRILSFYEPYPFQKLFHDATLDYAQVLLMAANRVGKTLCGSMDLAFHLTGLYPEWWKGRRFKNPNKWWVSGTTNDKTRDILQTALLGDPKDPGAFGTGTIPGELITGTTRKPGIPNALSAFAVKHVSGGNSVCAFKAYEQGPEAFMGESLDGILLDEEPPESIYSQCLVRVLDRHGVILLTFTPENGSTNLVQAFMVDKKAGQIIINATWDDAPHLDAETKKQILEAIPEHEREMRSKGVPMLGSGLVFPILESRIKVPKIDFPSYIPRIAGLDFGYDHPTAVVDCAWDRDTDTFYVLRCYRKSKLVLSVYAKEIREFLGETRVAWPHDGGKHDPGSGEGLAVQYRNAGVKMLPMHFTNPAGPGQTEGQGGNSVEPGIQAVLTAMEAGKFKVLDVPENQVWFQEFRMYHRNQGIIVKNMDDLMSATRYAYMSRRHSRVPGSTRKAGTYAIEENPLEGAYGRA